VSVQDAYLANYDRIAQDHVDYWRDTGRNPFQNSRVVTLNENNTVRLFEQHCSGAVLDAGCGMGDLLLRIPGMGVEIAKPYLKVCRERGLRVRKAPIEDMPFGDETFGTVIATDVLEHVIDIHAATKELLRVAKPNGHIIVRVPDSETVEWQPDYVYRFTHLRILDEGTMCALFGHIFECEIVETLSAEGSLHVVARKCSR
jgi:2-polyprenyl-3-methyl-5-hydroxy-6-metoxy-1,4-benzoquinol methylase